MYFGYVETLHATSLCFFFVWGSQYVFFVKKTCGTFKKKFSFAKCLHFF